MRVALLSDIHGNADALNVVLASAQSSGCERYLIAGDLVGYYYDACKVLKMLSNLDYEHVLGNHEQMLCALIENPSLDDEIRKKYGSALRVSIEQLSKKQLKHLIDAPKSKSLTIENKLINISHGAPWQYDFYIYPDSSDDVWKKFLPFEESIFIVGNTHHQLIKRFRGKLIINPGSVGQSRTDRGSAQWAELDLGTLDVTFKSLFYDTSETYYQSLHYDPDLEQLRKYL
jgi:putative phosphoesterase